MGVYLNKNNFLVRTILRLNGFSVCHCTKFKGADWLHYSLGCPYDIHGSGFSDPDNGITREFIVKQRTESILHGRDKYTDNVFYFIQEIRKLINR